MDARCRPAAIGFDLGETLLTYAGTPLNWAGLYPAALAQVAASLGTSPAPAEFDRALAILSRANTRLNPRRDEIQAGVLFAEILTGWRHPVDPAGIDGAVETFFGFFQQRMTPYPESGQVLAGLRQSGIRLGVLTDVPYGMPRRFVQRDLDGAGLAPLIDDLVTSVDVGRRKPDPVGFQQLARQLGTTPGAMWFVGNEEKDVRGALAAGMAAILVDRDDHHPAWGEDHRIGDLAELTSLLASALPPPESRPV